MPEPSIDVDKLSLALRSNAKPHSIGRCAHYVRLALEAGGAKTSGHPAHAKDWGGVLLRNGYQKLGKSLFSLVLLCLCSLTATAASPAPTERLINGLYKEFGCPGPSVSTPQCDIPEADQRKAVTEQSRATLRRYFDTSLVALLEKEQQCIIKTQEICNLDFDLLYASQDPDAADLRIKAAAPNKVIVSFRYPSNGERITIQYLLVQTRNGPRINDVIYPNDTSLRKLLMTKLP